MERRRFLELGGTATALALAGCSEGTGSADGTTARPDDAATDRSNDGDSASPRESAASTTATGKPDGVYVQPFRERMSMQGTATAGDYAFALLFAVPHDFWTVTGRTVSKISKEPSDSVHLMALVWDPETRTVIPETGLSVEITRDDELVSQETIYPMLSQPMGFHYGGNFELPGDGTYTVTVSVGGMTVRRTGAFAGRFGEPASAEITLEFTPETRSEVTTTPIDQGGQPGALGPMEMGGLPASTAPAESTLPGTVRGAATSDDARFLVTTLSDADRVGADGAYLAVSARTRYNGYVLPAMALSATLDRGGTTVSEGSLERTLSPDLGYHYGTAVEEVQSGDELTLSVGTPPQVARHEGYETAFRQFEAVSVTL